MKRTIFIGCLIALLSACGTDLTETELSTAGFSDVPIVTDNEQIAEGLGAAGFETILTEPDNLLEVHNEVGGGLVSYTPLPPEIDPWPWPWNPRPWPIPWCDPRWCDPIDFSPVVGWDFEGAYITPKFAETLAGYDVDAHKVVNMNGYELAKTVNPFEPKIIIIICDHNGCRIVIKPDPDPICPVCGGLGKYLDLKDKLTTDLFDADVVIVDSPALVDVKAELGNLIQLQGEGVAPVIQGLNVAVHPKVGEEMGNILAESLLNEEVQVSLYKHAGVLPVIPHLLDEVMDEHIEGALNTGHGGVGPRTYSYQLTPKTSSCPNVPTALPLPRLEVGTHPKPSQIDKAAHRSTELE